MRQLAPALLAGCLALTLYFAGTCAYSTTSLISHHTKPVSREGFPAVYDPTATDVPCSTVNCPHVEEEAPIRGYGSILRRFPSERWVSTGSDTWTWKHLAAMDFKEGFLRILDYRGHNSFMQRPLPITTPFLIGLTADVMLMDENEARHPDAALIPVKMKSGFTLYSYVDPSVADDPYAEPTDLKLKWMSWSPSAGADWVAVYQWTEPLEEGRSADNDVAVHFTVFRNRLKKALAAAGAPRQPLDKFFVAVFGSPVDRVYELWVPIQGDELRHLRQ
mmetsp:Transcript_34081/g.88429  ORF Transcript_34081/g.88429 Transcript_34081/m.88429 type:complete len:276 (+) Transcript_34081:191-1018(+)|eukprot:jgi/Tetstr1/422897/TSEL_013680.t1